MGQLYLPKLVRIQYNNKTIKEIEINVKSNLKMAREKWEKHINFPFVFVDDLNFYLFPNANLSETQKKEAFNIMVVGETGVSKSTWINTLLNYLEWIEIDENIRFLLFDEKQKRKEYEKKYRIKYLGESETDTPEIFWNWSYETIW